MKPLETHYAGRRFRSRLEARWAVFFDAMHIQWEYEPEGFDLGEGFKYLPDFRLVRQDVYVEVKPPGGNWSKALRFAEHKPIILLAGEPRAGRGDSLGMPLAHKWSEYSYSTFDKYLECSAFFELGGVRPRSIMSDVRYPRIIQQLAVDKALSARFGVHE